jgi:outer membrane protein TolC
LNNVFFGGGTRLLQQDLHRYQAQISKRSATGGEFTARKIFDYDANNSPGNNDPALPWGVQLEGEFRQPLFQGAGVEFNRIAGPGATPGVYRGVLIARVNTDISLAEFEIGVRNLVNDVENLYWELYYAYRDLDAKVAARNRALEVWRRIDNLRASGRRGGELEQEAQAREQYFRLESEVQNALSGGPADRVRSNVFRGAGGVQATERRLRLLMGIPVTDGRLIRPSQDPLAARILFDWRDMVAEALTRRPELRQQKWAIKRAELELAASKNFLLPRVDAVGRYRFRGLGHNLLNAERQPMRFDNAVQDLTTGDFQEWQMGVEVELPIGFRRAHAAVRNAEIALARQHAILDAQEQEVVHDLSAAYAEVQRAYAISQTNFNRRLAAMQQLDALENKFRDADEGESLRLLDLLLNAQRRLADAESDYFRSLIEYTLAVKNVHLQKGSLLDYSEVYLAEGPWPAKAYADAEEREATTVAPPPVLEQFHHAPPPVSRGPYGQSTIPFHAVPDEAASMSPEELVPLPPPADEAEPAATPASSS